MADLARPSIEMEKELALEELHPVKVDLVKINLAETDLAVVEAEFVAIKVAEDGRTKWRNSPSPNGGCGRRLTVYKRF